MDKVMPFGKYKSIPIRDLPYDYIEYILDNYDLKYELKRTLSSEINRRDNLISLSECKLKTAYKQMALMYHPDRGGSNLEMQAVNNFYQLLKQICLC